MKALLCVVIFVMAAIIVIIISEHCVIPQTVVFCFRYLRRLVNILALNFVFSVRVCVVTLPKSQLGYNWVSV